MSSVITLIGMPASGKTTVGKYLAQMLQMSFLDLDELIEQTSEMKIPQIFENYGEHYFRDLESKAIMSILKNFDGVLAVGGGTACHSDNILKLNEYSTTVWLDVSLDELIERCKKVTTRPLLASDDMENSLTQLLNKREKFYQQAHFRVKNEDDINDVANQIISCIECS